MNKTVDFSPAILDLVLYAGDGEDFQVSFISDDDPPVPVDVSDKTWAAQIRKTRTSDTAYDLDVNTDDAGNGNIVIHISATITRSLPAQGQWDLQCSTPGNDEPTTLIQGSVKCNQDVTRESVPVL